MPLLLGLTALILAEIALFVTIGAWIGLGLTLFVVLGSALAGALILRAAGRGIVDRLVGAASRRQSPFRQAGDGVLLAIAGLLLILPGFLTDLAGLFLLLPAVRQILLTRLAQAARQPGGAFVVDVAMAAPPEPRPGRPSPWSGPAGAVDAEVIAETPPQRPGSRL